MNPELLALAKAAGAPKEALTELWFHTFCAKFADQILTALEEEEDRLTA